MNTFSGNTQIPMYSYLKHIWRNMLYFNIFRYVYNISLINPGKLGNIMAVDEVAMENFNSINNDLVF